MNGENSNQRVRARNLMMSALDGEISKADRAELDRLLAGDEWAREEWDKLRRVKEVTGSMGYKQPPPEVWDDYWGSVYNRTERGAGWILVSLGSIVLAGYGIWQGLQQLLADSGVPGFIKVAIFAVLLGAVLLLFSVLREKLFTRARDPYKEIQR